VLKCASYSRGTLVACAALTIRIRSSSSRRTLPTVTRSGAEVVVRFGVEDAAAEHARLASLGVDVGELERVENVIEYFNFPDPDGNLLSMYAEVKS
jgi:hypothetical protein